MVHFRAKKMFPIYVDKELLWVEDALVGAEIPMLLGNNIFKPLEAEIQLFKSGDGILGKVDVKIRETRGGHYTLRV